MFLQILYSSFGTTAIFLVLARAAVARYLTFIAPRLYILRMCSHRPIHETCVVHFVFWSLGLGI